MSYQHMFYGVDMNRLKSIFGSGDEKLVAEVLQAQAEELAGNDSFFEVEDQTEAEQFPNSETALREIVAGKVRQDIEMAGMYGYVLKILCEHIGSPIGADVAAVRDHPYDSQLVASGPPIPIPYDRSDFSEIGFLALADIPAEIARIDAAPKRAKRSLLKSVLSSLSGGMVGRQMSAEDAAEDMAAYRETLTEAMDKGLSIVSFRH